MKLRSAGTNSRILQAALKDNNANGKQKLQVVNAMIGAKVVYGKSSLFLTQEMENTKTLLTRR